MDFQLGGNYRGELLRARLAQTLSADDLAFLYPEYPKDAPTTLAALAPLYRELPLARLYAALPAGLGPHYASNNWVVDGAHTASGKPLLANDPHLGFSTPGFWYLARLKTPEHEIEGGTVAGTPLVVIGHNEQDRLGFHHDDRRYRGSVHRKARSGDPSHYMVADGSAPVQDAAGDDRCARRQNR
jgi:penicillin amidase